MFHLFLKYNKPVRSTLMSQTLSLLLVMVHMMYAHVMVHMMYAHVM